MSTVPTTPRLDTWLPRPSVRVIHRRESSASAAQLWDAARGVRLSDTHLLGRLVRWRIPGTPANIPFDELFRRPPFHVLEEYDDGALISGLVGKIWTLRRDYPRLSDPEEFRGWSKPGTARVVLANWVEVVGDGRAALVSESRVEAIGIQGRLGLRAVQPLIAGFQHLVASEGITAAVRTAERQS